MEISLVSFLHSRGIISARWVLSLKMPKIYLVIRFDLRSAAQDSGFGVRPISRLMAESIQPPPTPPPIYPKLSTQAGASELFQILHFFLIATSSSFTAIHGAEVAPPPPVFCKGQKSNGRHGQHNRHLHLDDFRSAVILSHEQTHKTRDWFCWLPKQIRRAASPQS